MNCVLVSCGRKWNVSLRSNRVEWVHLASFVFIFTKLVYFNVS